MTIRANISAELYSVQNLYLMLAVIKKKIFTKEFGVQIISMLFIILFTYAAMSKLLDMENFKLEIDKSPLLSNYTNLITLGIPLIEIFISILLLIPKMRMIALHISLVLMTSFTAYIFIVLNYTNYIPCSCGGILEQLGWTEHLIFNSAFIGMAILAILLNTSDINKYKSSKNLIAQ